MLFDKYLNFIDVYAGIREYEREAIFLEDTGLNTQIGGRLKRLAGMLHKGAFMLTYGDGVCDVDLQKPLAFHKPVTHSKCCWLFVWQFDDITGN